MLPQNSLPTEEIMQMADEEICGVDASAEKCLLPDLIAPDPTMTVKIERMVEQEGDPCTFPDDEPDSQLDNPANDISPGDHNEPVKPPSKQNQVPPPTASYRSSRGKARGRRTSRWKLKFHHQALPPEYLDHYEASCAQLNANTRTDARNDARNDARSDARAKPSTPKSGNNSPHKSKKEGANLANSSASHEAHDSQHKMKSLESSLVEHMCLPVASESDLVMSRLQDLKMREKTSSPNDKLSDGKTASEKYFQSNGLLGSLLSDREASVSSNSVDDHKKRISNPTSLNDSSGGKSSSVLNSSQRRKIVNYQDLPYMGEITLDNMKPRRGRKPKKADICHLIYKNYGTIFQGGPKVQEKELQSSLPATKVISENVLINSLRCKAIESLKSNAHINHTDVQNKIISSLLEKRLTAASHDSRKCPVSTRNQNTYVPSKGEVPAESAKRASHEEPLNLCVKDLNQLKIRLQRKHGNFYEPTPADIVVKTELGDSRHLELEADSRPDSSIGNMSGEDLNHFIGSQPGLLEILANQPAASPDGSATAPLPGGYVYWPNAGVFVHPMALQSQILYYRKMGTLPLLPGAPTEQSKSVSQPSSTATQPKSSPVGASKPAKSPSTSKPLVPKAFSMMMDPASKTSVMPSELSFPRMKRLAPSGNLPAMGSPAKRKRSAIFIPPMPSENNANPTTEVSICKFKFTGGAKPSLQEKKMLSVDSGGNFRYYSGTGDKSMRGYEFFPRESLQQTGNTAGSSSEHFLTASAMGSGAKITVQTPPPSETQSKGNSPKEPNRNGEGSSHFFDNESEISAIADPLDINPFAGQDEEQGSPLCLRRKRKTRKSLAREKLEQTFKEKGFLIQTQQLESAEGATYCKFRQLRKFTRYLFRSWKDYLPGNVREMSVAAGVSGPQDAEQDVNQMSSNPPTPHTITSLDESNHSNE